MLVVTSVFVAFVGYSSIVSQVAQLWRCNQYALHDNALRSKYPNVPHFQEQTVKSYLAHDMRTECSGSEYFAVLLSCTAVGLVYGIGSPAGVFLILRKYSKAGMLRRNWEALPFVDIFGTSLLWCGQGAHYAD